MALVRKKARYLRFKYQKNDQKCIREVQIPDEVYGFLRTGKRYLLAKYSDEHIKPSIWYINSQFMLNKIVGTCYEFIGSTKIVLRVEDQYIGKMVMSHATLRAWPHYLANHYCLQYTIRHNSPYQISMPDRLIVEVDDRRVDTNIIFTNTGFAIAPESVIEAVKKGASLRIYGGCYPWIARV